MNGEESLTYLMVLTSQFLALTFSATKYTTIFKGSAQEQTLDFGDLTTALEIIYDPSLGYIVWRAQQKKGTVVNGYKLYSYKVDRLDGTPILLDNSTTHTVCLLLQISDYCR